MFFALPEHVTLSVRAYSKMVVQRSIWVSATLEPARAASIKGSRSAHVVVSKMLEINHLLKKEVAEYSGTALPPLRITNYAHSILFEFLLVLCVLPEGHY